MIYYKKNHWYVIIINFFTIIKKLWPFILMILVPTIYYAFLTLALISIAILVFCFYMWLNEFIVVDGDNLLYKKGILYSQKIKIPLESISLLEFNQNILYAILGLRKIKIESISPNDKKFEIIMILKKRRVWEFQKLISKLEDAKLEENANIFSGRKYKLSLKHLLVLATLRSNILIGIGIIYSLVQLLEEFDQKMGTKIKDILIKNIEYGISRREEITGLVICLFIVIILIVSVIMLFSILGIMSRYYKYRLYRINNHIYINHGFIVRLNYSIKVENIHAIKIEQNFINQILDLYMIKASVVGFGNSAKEDEIMFPICKRSECTEIIKQIVPEFSFDEEISKPPKKAFNNFYISWVSYSVIFAVIIYLAFNKSLIGCFAIPLMILWRYLIKRNSALGIGKNILLFSSGSFIRRITLVRNSSMIQCMQVVNIFQRRKKICDYRIKFYNQKKFEWIRIKNMDNIHYDKIKKNMNKDN